MTITRRPRTLAAAAAVAAVALGSLTACGSASGAKAADGSTVVRYQSYSGAVDPLQLAAALGKLPGVTLKKEGDVTGGPASLQALVSNQIDISSSAFYGAIAQVVATGAPIKSVVATYGTNAQTSSAIVALKDSSLTADPHSLIGKKVAVNTLGANAEAVLDTWFAKSGLSADQIKQITLVALPPLNTLQALKQGQVDAAYISSGQLRAAGAAVSLKTLTTDAKVIGYYNGGGVSLRNDWIQNHADVSRTLASGIGYAIDYIASHKRAEVLAVYDKWLRDNGYADAVDAVDQNWSGSTGVSTKGGSIADKDISIWLAWLSSRGDVDLSKVKPSDVYTNALNTEAGK
ncbi:ABC-type transport system periplasmic component [Nocardioides baekrokdamisoli]|uniref:ABC-type transport system periplasmic component n=1 Tax=Nocardioides baekrokdamisoli TaxID=1804624 RepID=A0A3G9IDL3_9ACTN|nr:ABC transporter substrate-binding protein [Nocardioides baekrokdamisoli]BBH16446.1 ABC-type transport system periplasmic component [Nocardioides baekrokdamisoli]